MASLKDILAGIRSCFSLSANERLIIILIAALFLLGLALRWWYLKNERPDRRETPPPAMNTLKK